MIGKIPKLAADQMSVMFSEVNTGIVVCSNGERFIGEGEYYKIFDNEVDATAFSQSYVAKYPSIECSIRDKDGNFVKTIQR